MTLGHVRDNFARVTLSLTGLDGPVFMEFVLDTGFDGELALPGALLARLDATYSSERAIVLADGTFGRRPVYEVVLDWQGGERVTDVLVSEGAPLLGVNLLEENLVQMEMTDGGEVQIEPL